MMIAVHPMTTHNNMAAITGLYYTITKVGEVTGAAVSGVIWTQKIYPELAKRLGSKSLGYEAYSSPYAFIEKYTWGTTERASVAEAYTYIQRLTHIMIVALNFTAPLILFALLMKHNKLTDDISKEGDIFIGTSPENKNFSSS